VQKPQRSIARRERLNNLQRKLVTSHGKLYQTLIRGPGLTVPYGLRSPSSCCLWGCWKTRSTPFPGRMSQKATKPGSICLIICVSWVCFVLFSGVTLISLRYFLFDCVLSLVLVVMVTLSVPVQVIYWKDSSPKW